MPRLVEVHHQLWICAPAVVVRAQFADLDHHIQHGVHPKLRFEVLERQPHGLRFAQEVRLLGIRQRDVFVRRIEADGTIVDRAVEGFNRGGSLVFRFHAAAEQGQAGTLVDITIRLPLPPVVGPLIRPLLERQVRREVMAAGLQDKTDIEAQGYPRAGSAAPNLRQAGTARAGS